MSKLGAPQQHSQPSRKGKKAWRKNVDVTDVQDGLEEYQKDIRAGGPFSEKSSEDLFAVDTLGSPEITKKYDLQKPLRADQIIAQRSLVPPVESRKRTGQDAPTGIYEPAMKRQRGDWVSKKDVQRLKKTIASNSHLHNDLATDEPASSFDLWDSTPVPTVTDRLEYVPKRQPKVAPTTIQRAPVAMTASGKAIKPVPQPAKGSSYNPDYDEWNEVIIEAGDKELAAEKARLEEEQAKAEKQARIQVAMEEESAARTDDESAWEGFETENEDTEALRKKRPSRKTPTERNKVKRRKAAERLAKHDLKMANKKKVTDELARLVASGALTFVDQDNDLVDVVNHANGDDSMDDGNEEDKKIRRRKLGNAIIPERNLEVVLPDELQDSLRRLKPEGNLLQDRFRNLLVNGKVESRKPVLQPKKKRVKYTEKWSFKDFEISV